MILNGVDFGCVFWASGAVNFGEGWWYDPYLKFVPGYKTDGITIITKTSSLESRLGPRNNEPGYMTLRDDLQPKKWFPDCIKLYFLKCAAMNAVSLSGPGLKVLLETGMYQKKGDPKIISIMATGQTEEDRLLENAKMGRMFRKEMVKDYPYFPRWAHNVAFEENISCPNTQHDHQVIGKSAVDQLFYFRAGLVGFFDHLGELEEMDFRSCKEIVASLSVSKIKSVTPFGNIPAGIKVNLLMSPASAKTIVDSGLCDFISVPNTVPWLELEDKIDWQGLFKTKISPLAKYGGGGLSSWQQTAPTADWISDCRSLGIRVPINAGSLYNKQDPALMKKAGGSGAVIGAVKLLRPWRVGEIVEQAKKCFG